MAGKASATLNKAKTLKMDGSMKMEKHKGTVKGSLDMPDMDPMAVEAEYSHEPTADKCHCGLQVSYGKGKHVKLDMKVKKPSKEDIEMEIDLKTPSDMAKHLNLVLKGKVRIINQFEKISYISPRELVLARTMRDHWAVRVKYNFVK